MGTNLTDTAAFTDPIVAPADGEPGNAATFALGLQGLANRTRHHKNRLDAHDSLLAAVAGDWGVYSVGNGSSIGSAGAKSPIAQIAATAGLALAGTDITVAAAGLYLVSLTANAGCTLTADPQVVNMLVDINGSTFCQAEGMRFSASTGHQVCLAVVSLALITAGQVVSVKSALNGAYSDSTKSRLILARLK